jgi:hypothetical protein
MSDLNSSIKSELLEMKYDELEEVRGVQLESCLLKAGKLAYVEDKDGFFSYFESTNSTCKPAADDETTVHSYHNGVELFEPTKCASLIHAIDELMFEQLLVSRIDKT